MSSHAYQSTEDSSVAAEDAAIDRGAFLNRPITLAFGAGREAPVWRNETRGTVGKFLSFLEVPDPKLHTKDGPAFLQGSLVKGATKRLAKNMGEMWIVGFDVESGELPETIFDNAVTLGIEARIYPTFNDGKPETRLATDAVNRWAKIGPHNEATAEHVLEFLRDQKGYQPWIMETAKFVGRENQEYVVTHAPLPRFRVVAVWQEPVKLATLAPTLAGIKQTWEAVYRHVGAKFGIKHLDESCTDLSRLFYAHRRPEGAEHWGFRVEGYPVDFAALLVEARAAQTNEGEAADKSADVLQTPGLLKFLGKHGDDFEAADWLRSVDHDGVRHDYGGKIDFACPNEDGHTEPKPDDRAFVVENASNRDNGFWMFCHHAGCKQASGDDRAWYLDRLCQHYGVKHAKELVQFCPNAEAVQERDSAANTDDRPAIDMDQDYETRVGLAVQHLNDSQRDNAGEARRDATLYHNTRGVVRLIRRAGQTSQLKIEELGTSRTAWRAEIETRMTFEKDGETVPARKELIERTIGMQHDLELAELKRVVHLPVFAPDGTLCTEPGYNEALKAYHDPRGDFRSLPDVITEKHIDKALSIIAEMVRDIPFSDAFGEPDTEPQYLDELDEDGWPLPNFARGSASRLMFVTLLLQPIVRGMIQGPCPAYHIDKPVPGTGASLLADVLYAVLTGETASARPETTDSEELRKQLTTALRGGGDLILWDNLNCHLDSGALAAALTAGKWQDRLLHTNTDVVIDVTQTFVLAGNGLSMSAELSRRMAPIFIDANVEHPDRERPPIKDGARFKYAPLVEQYVLPRRADIVWALHILPAYYVQERNAGRYVAKPRKDPMGTFESYYSLFSAIYDACNIDGFMEHRETYLNVRNVEKDNLSGFIDMWLGKTQKTDPLATEALTATEIFSLCANPVVTDHLTVELPISGRDKEGRIVSLGRLLRKITGRVFHVRGVTVKVVKARDRNPSRYMLRIKGEREGNALPK